MLFLLIATSYAAWTKSPNVQISRFQETNSTYSLSTQDFEHIRYPSAYDVNMYYAEGIQDYNNISAFHKVSEQQLLSKGCVFDQRRIRIEDVLELPLPEENSFIFTDLLVVGNTSFLVRNDNRIFQIDLKFTDAGDLMDLRLDAKSVSFNHLLQYDLYKHPQFFTLANRVYIVTELGAVSFEATQLLIDENPLRLEQTRFKNQIQSIYFDKHQSMLFVVSGTEGIDAYLVNDTLQYKYTIQSNLQVLKVQSNCNHLFVLDNKVGIHLYTFDSEKYEAEDFSIPIENAASFIYDRNSFVVIAETNQKMSFGIEILVDFNTKEYFYNKFYLEDMQLRDVQSDGQFALIIGFDVHKVIQTNIFKGFVDDDFDYDNDFMVPLLEKVEIFRSPRVQRAGRDLYYILSITPYILQAQIIEDHKPEIVCQSLEEIKQTYIVQINSTDCEAALQSPFSICQSLHRYQIKVNEVLIDSQQAFTAELFVIIIGVVFVGLLLCGVYMCRRWKLIIRGMQTSIQKLENKKKYQNLAQFRP